MHRYYTFFVYLSHNRLDESYFYSHSVTLRMTDFRRASRLKSQYESWFLKNTSYLCKTKWEYELTSDQLEIFDDGSSLIPY